MGALRGLKRSCWGTSWFHSRVPLVPLTRMARLFSTPAAAWVTQKGATCAVFKMKEGTGVVMENAIGGDGTGFCSDFGDFETGDEAGEVVGVGADVSHYEGGTTGFGVEAPREGTVGRGRDRFSSALPPWTYSIWTRRMVPSCPSATMAFGLTDEGVAGVVVGEAEDEAGFLNFLV